MRQIHFIVSIKTVDNTPLFPSNFNGESFLLETTIKVSTQFKILTKGYSSFPTGLEAIICCSNISEAKKYINVDVLATNGNIPNYNNSKLSKRYFKPFWIKEL